MMRSVRYRHVLVSALLVLAGCRKSPTIDVLGSYFPAWMVCIVLGLVLTLITRQILIGLKLNAHLRPLPLIYLCLMILFTMASWLVFYKN